jgi:hypothetical protein
MTTVTAFMPGSSLPQDSGQRLTVAFALSVIAHVILIAMFAGLLEPMLAPIPGRIGQALPIEVALVGVRPIAFTAPPESPAMATELPTTPQTMGAAPTLLAASPPSPPKAAPSVNAPPLGVSVQADANADVVSADAPPPPGNTSVSPVADSERLGHTQALRLAQRFPHAAARIPRLQDPLIVPYPPRAARAHAEARIAAVLTIDESGRIVDTTLVPDEPLFGPTILDSLKHARFVPAEGNAKPIPYWMVLEFVFKMGRPVVTPRPPA